MLQQQRQQSDADLVTPASAPTQHSPVLVLPGCAWQRGVRYCCKLGMSTRLDYPAVGSRLACPAAGIRLEDITANWSYLPTSQVVQCKQENLYLQLSCTSHKLASCPVSTSAFCAIVESLIRFSRNRTSILKLRHYVPLHAALIRIK